MSDEFATQRCLPWLTTRDDVRVIGAPEPVAPGVALLRGRLRPPWSLRLKFAGLVSLVASLLVMMGAARPPRAEGQPRGPSSLVRGAEVGLGALGLGAFALGRRLDRSAPGVSILCMAAGADRREPGLDALAADARRRLSADSWPEGPVWMISEHEPAAAARDRARELGLRVFFPDRAGRIHEA